MEGNYLTNTAHHTLTDSIPQPRPKFQNRKYRQSIVNKQVERLLQLCVALSTYQGSYFDLKSGNGIALEP